MPISKARKTPDALDSNMIPILANSPNQVSLGLNTFGKNSPALPNLAMPGYRRNAPTMPLWIAD